MKDMHDVDLGFAVTEKIRKYRGSYSKDDIKKFRLNYRNFIAVLLEKLLQRCPLKYDLIKGASCLDPNIMFHSTKNVGRLNLALTELVAYERMSGEEADTAKEDYINLTNNSLAKDVAKNFVATEDRLDTLWFKKLLKINQSEPLLKMVSHILVLSHGQASVE